MTPCDEGPSGAERQLDAAKALVHAADAHGAGSLAFRDAADALARSLAAGVPDAPPAVRVALARRSILACDERARRASHGPWRVGSVAAEGKVWVPYAGSLEGPHGERCLLTMNPHFPHDHDRTFIAHARDDVPFLAALALGAVGAPDAR